MEKIYDCGSHVGIQGGADDDIYVVGRTHGYATGLCLTLEGHAYLLAENCRVEAGDEPRAISRTLRQVCCAVVQQPSPRGALSCTSTTRDMSSPLRTRISLPPVILT